MKKERKSNLELLRIFAMLIIVAHHYVVLSGIQKEYDFNNITGNMIFLQFAGFGGKMAINVFVIISSYFMCTQKVTYGRVLKLVLQVYFYSIVLCPIFIFAGYQSYDIVSLLKLFFEPIISIGHEFVGSFIVFYMLVPFLNKLIGLLSKIQHLRLSLFLLLIFSVFFTLLAKNACRYVGWFITLYFITSYIRLYPNKYVQSRRYALWLFVVSLILSWMNVLFIDFVGTKHGFNNYYYFCIDSQKILAFILALSLFLLFNNINIKQSKLINTLAASAFGVLLIHSNSLAMRNWLWKDLLHVPNMYISTFLPLHFFCSVIGIYLVCAIIDYFRIRFIESPLFLRLNKYSIMKKECLVE